MFRDISVRQTFRHLVKQQRKLKDVRKNDFRTFVRQNKSRMNLALCIDVSGSMGKQSKISFAKLAAAAMTRAAIEEGDKVGIVAFNNYGKIIMPLAERMDSIINSLMTLKACHNTNIGDGIKRARELLLHTRDGNQKYIILFTDGEPTATTREAIKNLSIDGGKIIGEEYALEEAKKTASKGIKILVLFVAEGNEMSKKFVKTLAKIGGGFLYEVAAAEDLPISTLKVWQKAKSL